MFFLLPLYFCLPSRFRPSLTSHLKSSLVIIYHLGSVSCNSAHLKKELAEWCTTEPEGNKHNKRCNIYDRQQDTLQLEKPSSMSAALFLSILHFTFYFLCTLLCFSSCCEDGAFFYYCLLLSSFVHLVQSLQLAVGCFWKGICPCFCMCQLPSSHMLY